MSSDITVIRTEIDTMVVYSAWRRHDGTVFDIPNRSISFIEDESGSARLHGRIGTEILPEDVAAMPRGSQRLAAVKSWHAGLYAQAYEAILAEYPEAQSGRQGMGEIVL